MPRLSVRLLGPVDLLLSAETITLDRPLERALVARLALARGAAVSDERLARDLWGDVDLARPKERLRVLASRLRANLGAAADALSRTAAGYVLDAAPDDVIQAEKALSNQSREVIAQALALWRGDSLADLRAVPFGFAEGERLDALRTDLQVARLALELDAGAGAELRPELEELAREHPLHERLYCMLAVALYRDSRQADALATLQKLRERLADELGVDPAPETVHTELQLLRQDPSLHGTPQKQLPSVGTTFLGRDADRAALVERLGTARLITLTGVAGSGKTRLALEVAKTVDRPVVWLDLTAAGATDEIDPSALEGALLVLDNAEHVLSDTAQIVTNLLVDNGKLSILVTSQRPLLAEGEEVRHVGGLPPAAAALLFCDRSGAAPGPDVDAICTAVDHLPLGVELAAGLTRTLSVPQLARRLDDRLRLLVGGLRDSRQRHGSLRAALDWSHELLDDVHRIVLRRAAVFLGGFTLEAAEQVLPDDDLDRHDIAAALTELVDRNLLQAVDGPRFRMLETVRHYALDKLHEGEEVRARHIAWCAEHVAQHDISERTATELDALVVEWPNLLGALDSAPGTPRAAAALRLAVALDDAWMVRGLVAQAARVYATLIDADVTDTERAYALCNYGFVATQMGRLSLASALLDRAEPLATDDRLAMRVLYYRGIAEIERGWPALATDLLTRGLKIAERLENQTSASAFASTLALAHMYAGDNEQALRVHEEWNALDRAAGDEHGLARGLVNEGMALLTPEHAVEALARADEAEELAERLGDAITLAHVGIIRGRVAVLEGRHTEAEEHFRVVLEEAEPGVDLRLLRVDLAYALLKAGREDEARAELAATEGEEQDVTWLAAQPVAAALAGAESAQIVAEAKAEFARRAFGWSLAVNRFDA